MDNVERLPWMEHERRHREREGKLALRTIEPEPGWQVPKPVEGPDPLDVADEDGIGPIARLRRAALGQCTLCARYLDAVELEMMTNSRAPYLCVDCTHRKGVDKHG